MDIKFDLLANTLSDLVRRKVEEAFDDLQIWTQATSMVMLAEIWEIIDNENLSRSEIVEKITYVYDKHNVDCIVHRVF